MRIAVVVVTAATMLLSGCGTDTAEQDSAPDSPTTEATAATTTAPEPADSAPEDSASVPEAGDPIEDDSDLISATEANMGALGLIVVGEQFDHPSGVSITVTDVEVLPASTWEGVSWAPSHSMMIRAENRSGEEIMAPLVDIYCTETPTGVLPGGGIFVSSTYPMNQSMPDGTYVEGSLLASLPSDDDGVYVPGCAEPFLEFSLWRSESERLDGEWRPRNPGSGEAFMALPELS